MRSKSQEVGYGPGVCRDRGGAAMKNLTEKGKGSPTDTSYFTTEFGANPVYFTFLKIPGPLRKK